MVVVVRSQRIRTSKAFSPCVFARCMVVVGGFTFEVVIIHYYGDDVKLNYYTQRSLLRTIATTIIIG